MCIRDRGTAPLARACRPGTLLCESINQHVLSANTFSSSTTVSSPFLRLSGDPLYTSHTRHPSTGVLNGSVQIFAYQIRCHVRTVDWQTPAVDNVYSSSFPSNSYPGSSITWLDRPHRSRTHWPRWHGVTDSSPLGICNALIGRLPTAPRDVATSEAGSWSLVIESLEVVKLLTVLLVLI